MDARRDSKHLGEMRAILLAAGRGIRLGPLGFERPKCLLPFGGKSLLLRHLECLRGLGVNEIVLAVGYREAEVRAELDAEPAQPSPRPTTLTNPRFERGSVVSLWSVRDALCAGGDVLLMDADVLYDAAILARLVERPGNLFLMDRKFDDSGQEAVKLCLRRGVAVEFRKRLAADLAYDLAGESVGFFRFSEPIARALASRCDAYVAAGRLDEPYEEAIRDLLLETPALFHFEDITGLPWIEIDFPDDVRRAEEEILPRLSQTVRRA
jgi:choline kinase